MALRRLVNGPGRWIGLEYDAANRLDLMEIDGDTVDNPVYDANGRLAQKGTGTTVYYLNTINAATSTSDGRSFGYDSNGNMTTRFVGGVTYTLTYDAENRLVGYAGGSVNAAFVYDGDGKRVKGTVNGVTTTYVGNHYEVQGTTTRKYYFAGTQRIAVREIAGEINTLSFFLSDHLGSTAITVSDTGNRTGELRYSAWGETRYEWGATPTNSRYTGQMAEPDLDGLYYYGARWYDNYH